MEEIGAGLWWWSVRHPDWTPEDLEDGAGWEQIVSSYALVTDSELLLFDPLIEDWAWLDGQVEEHGPPTILLTLFWHARSSQQVLDRYDGATLWAHEPAAEWIGERTRYTSTFVVGDELPAGVEAIPIHRAQEVAYWLPAQDAAVIGDAILGHGERAGLFPPSWVRDDKVRAAAIEAVRELVDRRPARLLLTHGGPTDPSAVEV
ncbi:MAG TPA: MBL fold metallo-hydrolase [Gaiellaceae bacterium]|nr:MBL fold metallo-hydrolase [Gaiellaceae bacterium]